MNRNAITSPLYLLAVILTLLVPAVLYFEGISIKVVGLVVLSYAFLFIAFPSMSRRRQVGEKGDMLTGTCGGLHLVTEAGEHSLERYYARLLDNLDSNWQRFQRDHGNAEKALNNVNLSLGKALELSRSTELLAANTLLSASQSGEVGRGFVSVSRDLINLSERSMPDLQKLRQLLRGFTLELSRFQDVTCSPADEWLAAKRGMPVTKLSKLRTEIAYCQQQLQQISDHYRREPQQDVRWMQLGDAVRRLLNELINTLFQLELHIQDVLSDMRLLKLGEGVVDAGQIVEIKDRIQAAREVGGPTQKFMT